MNELTKLTPDEWLLKPAYRGMVIMDPDGWDRKNFEASWAEPITEDEFAKRMLMSTCLWPKRSM
jgi:hypothetical protein